MCRTGGGGIFEPRFRSERAVSYTPGYSFSGFQASRPDEALPGASLDAELADISAAVADLQARIADLRRSDGALVNGIVTADAMSADVRAAYTGGAVSAWAPVVAFASGLTATTTAPATIVTYNGETYVCAVDHTTTSTFVTGNWIKIAAKAANGAGVGDLLAANNLDDVLDTTQALANLGGVPLSGGTMTGLLVLSGDASASNGAVTKSQMETALAAKVSASALATVAVSGAYSALSGLPVLGTAASQSTGTAAGNVVQYASTNKLPATDGSALTNLPIAPHVIVEDRKTAGTNGASSVAATWVRRDLTTLVRNTIGASLASNQVTLPAGTYFARWTAPAYKTRGHKTRLYDVSSSATIAYGTSEWAEYDGYVQNSSSGSSVFTLATTGTIALDHYTLLGSGLMGKSSGVGTEVYSRLEIWKMS